MKFEHCGKAIIGFLLIGGIQLSVADDLPQLFKQVSGYRTNSSFRSEAVTGRSLRTGATTGTIDLSVLRGDFVIALGTRTAYGSVKDFADWRSSMSTPVETVSGMLLDKEGGSEIGTFAISYDRVSRGSIFGSFSLYEGDVYEITGNELVAQMHTVTKDLPECATNASHEVHHDEPSSRLLPPEPLGDAATTVDVLVAYSTEAQTAAGGVAGIESEIASAVSLANTAYTNSQVGISLRLVGTTVINGSESGNFSTDLSRLTNSGDGVWDDVHSRRNTLGADVVVLFVNNSTSCGLGWVMTNPGVSDDSIGFSVVSRQCISNFSFVHEIGHNMGATHDQGNAGGSTGAYSDSYGWRFTGTSGTTWRTVMAYQPGTRINYFSNPAINYDGVATGSTNVANNARTLNLTKSIVAGYRSSPSAPTPTPQSTPTAPPGSTPTETPANGGSGGSGGGISPVPTPFELAPTPEPTQATPGSGYSFKLRLVRRGNTLNLVVGVMFNNDFIVTDQAIPVPLQKVRKNEEPVYPLRSKVPEGTNKYPFQKTESSDFLNWNGYIQLIDTAGRVQTKMLQSNGTAKFKVRRGKSYQIEIDGVYTDWFRVR